MGKWVFRSEYRLQWIFILDEGILWLSPGQERVLIQQIRYFYHVLRRLYDNEISPVNNAGSALLEILQK